MDRAPMARADPPAAPAASPTVAAPGVPAAVAAPSLLPSFLPRAAAMPVIPANLAGVALVYFYFNYVDPLSGPQPDPPLRPLVVTILVATTLIGANVLIATRWLRPLERWRRRLAAGGDAAAVPTALRRRLLNAPLTSSLLTMAGWLLAGLFYFPYLVLQVGVSPAEAGRNFAGLVFVAGPMTSALTFLISEFYWRRQVPLFFPDGHLEQAGVLRVPVVVRLGGTFLVTAMLPLALMLMVDWSFDRRFGRALPASVQPLWEGLLLTQVFIVAVTAVASAVMALLVARFIDRPVQALRAAMARVAAGDLDVGVPVRSTDELGELAAHFNAMVRSLREAARVREIFGRYVSREVARQALERGIALGGEVVRATAMFVDLRGFTALTERTPAPRVVELLNDYYEIVERVCAREGGVITQFLGDGMVVVFGGPLAPVEDHARRAVRAAVALQRALAERNATRGGERLEAGIGICTGDLIAGNVGGARGRIAYTIVGDAVNQADRLQVRTREMGESILITESTRAALGDAADLRIRPCGAVPLKGIAAPVQVYAVEA
jgi:class 3 adenylate cyclase